MARRFPQNACIAPIAALSLLGLSACSGVPSLDVARTQEEGVTVKDLVAHVTCELAHSVELHPELARDGYVVNLNMTLKVVDVGGITPSLSFIHPFAAASSFFSNNISASYTNQQTRNFNQTTVFDMTKIRNDITRAGSAENTSFCKNKPSRNHNLLGSLGIEETANDALSSIEQYYFDVGVSLDPTKQGTVPTFGATIEFQVSWGANAGPSWSIRHFKGLGGQNNLANLGRTDTHTLVIAFTPASFTPKDFTYQKFLNDNFNAPNNAPKLVAPKAQEIPDTAKAAAAQVGQQTITNMILQNLRFTQ